MSALEVFSIILSVCLIIIIIIIITLFLQQYIQKRYIALHFIDQVLVDEFDEILIATISLPCNVWEFLQDAFCRIVWVSPQFARSVFLTKSCTESSGKVKPNWPTVDRRTGQTESCVEYRNNSSIQSIQQVKQMHQDHS